MLFSNYTNIAINLMQDGVENKIGLAKQNADNNDNNYLDPYQTRYNNHLDPYQNQRNDAEEDYNSAIKNTYYEDRYICYTFVGQWRITCMSLLYIWKQTCF